MKEAVERTWDDTGLGAVSAHLGGEVAFHGVRFTGTGLTVGKDGTVVAGHDFLEDRADDILVDHALICLWTKDLVEVIALLAGGRLWYEVGGRC